MNGIPGWIIGMALLITPYFGFETVPQMVEEGDFPIKNSKKAICGSILTCGCIYVFYYFCVAGLDGLKDIHANFAQDGFLTIATMQNVLGWTFWPDYCRYSFLPSGYGSIFAGILDVYRTYAVFHGK